MFNVNVEVKQGIGTIYTWYNDGDETQQYYTTRPMQLIYIDGVEVAYKTVDVDNLNGTIKYSRTEPAMYHNEDCTVCIYDFKPTSQQEFFSEVDRLVEKRFQNKRKEFVENTVQRYSENQMLRTVDRCLFIFDNERYHKESEQYNNELKEFFNNLFEN